MTAAASISDDTYRFQVRFSCSCLQGRAVTFPCDSHGEVDLDRLSEAGRQDYLFARIMVRRERVRPEIVRVHESRPVWQ